MAKKTREETDPERRGDADADEASEWAAPTRSTPLDARVTLPGSKSLMNRELVLAALADGPGVLRAPLRSRDATLMIDGLTALGADIAEVPGATGAQPDLRVTPAAELTGSTTVACGLAGTVMRFLPPVAALALGPVAFDGDPYARKRPMRELITALRDLGADIADEGRGALPFTVHGTGALTGGRVELDASASSQFVSGLLLSAPRFAAGVHVVHTGEQLPSVPHIEMTLDTLAARGVRVDRPAPGEWRVHPGPIRARDVTIEPDLSNAAPFLAAAVVAGGTVRVPNWPAQTTQVGDQLRELFAAFGATVTRDGDVVTVTGPAELRGADLHLPHAGELSPTLVGLAALAATPSTITGIGHTRHHETDRIAALVANITALGGRATELADGIRIEPAPLHGGVWRAHADHRMATTGAVIGLAVPGVIVDDIACTAKTLPDFPGMWRDLLADDAPALDPLPGSAHPWGFDPAAGPLS